MQAGALKSGVRAKPNAALLIAPKRSAAAVIADEPRSRRRGLGVGLRRKRLRLQGRLGLGLGLTLALGLRRRWRKRLRVQGHLFLLGRGLFLLLGGLFRRRFLRRLH